MTDYRELESYLEQKYNLTLMLSEYKNKLKVHNIISNEKNKGNGTNAMIEIVNYCNDNNLTLVLSPANKDDAHGTTSRNRLVKFYKRFDLIENKGRNKDFTISESMYKTPKN